MPDVLPAAPTPEAFEALAKDDARIVVAARLVADRHRLAGAPIARFAGGSLPVFALGSSRVLTFYPPCFPGEAEVELGVLQALEGKLPPSIAPPSRPSSRSAQAGPIPSGLFDFEPAMEGDPEYEFASVGVFPSGGDALGALIRAYGYPEVDGAQRRRFMA